MFLSIHLDEWARIAEVVIAIGTVVGFLFSVWYSRQSLKRADWNSNMATAPSVTIKCYRTNFWRSSQLSGGKSWGEPTVSLPPSSEYITFEIGFAVENQGRGVALGIKQPMVKCIAITTISDKRIPSSLGASNEDSSSFVVGVTEQHSQWLKLSGQPLAIEIEIPYANDQGNIMCVSRWTAEIRPFSVRGDDLLITNHEDRISNVYSEIKYQSK
jgi:hypothetical protein